MKIEHRSAGFYGVSARAIDLGVGPDTSTILGLRLGEGMSLAATAEAVDLPEATVRQLEAGAIRRLNDEAFAELTAEILRHRPDFHWHRSALAGRAFADPVQR